MLKIWIGPDSPNLIENPVAYYDAYKNNTWLNNEYAKRAIKGIDKSEHIKDEFIESPVLGAIPSMLLSGGVKTLLVLYNVDDINLYCTTCGNNCVPYLMDLVNIKESQNKDVTITLCHIMKFPDKFNAIIMNTGTAVHSFEEFLNIYGIIIRSLM